VAQLSRIHPIILVPCLHQGIFPRIAYDHFGDVWFQQIVQPGGAGPLFKRHPQTSLQPLEEFQDGPCFGFQDGFDDEFPGRVPDRNRRAGLMYVHPNILGAVHLGAPFVGPQPTYKAYAQRGALS
jgi:hypothetical protein